MANMTSDLDKAGRSAGDRARARAYYWDFWPGMIGYVAVLLGVLAWGHLDGDSSWRFLWAVLPVIPMLWVLRAVVRHLRRCDDYQQLLALRALVIGFAAAMGTAITLGFLGIARLVLPVPLASGGWIVFTAGMLAWGVAAGVLALQAQRR